jgi:polyhydroxyalkanoate synthesis regulator protein
MKLFNPFAAMAMSPGGGTTPPKPNSPPAQAPSKDDLQAMKDQLTAMQEKINTLSRN